MEKEKENEVISLELRDFEEGINPGDICNNKNYKTYQVKKEEKNNNETKSEDNSSNLNSKDDNDNNHG